MDNFFGGDGRHAKIEGREFTPTELRVVRMVLEQAFVDLKEAWQAIMEVNFEYINSEVNPAMANIVGPSEAIVVSTFHIELDGAAATALTCRTRDEPVSKCSIRLHSYLDDQTNAVQGPARRLLISCPLSATVALLQLRLRDICTCSWRVSRVNCRITIMRANGVRRSGQAGFPRATGVARLSHHPS